MRKELKNYAFIDSQNINLSVRELGWNIGWRSLRVYLREKYDVDTAYMFIGYIPELQNLYRSLQKWGFVLVFKPVLRLPSGRVKGNVDAELVLQAMIDFKDYEKAVILTGDGDFYCLVNYLYEQGKLEVVLAPSEKSCSALLKKAARGKLRTLQALRGKLEYK